MDKESKKIINFINELSSNIKKKKLNHKKLEQLKKNIRINNVKLVMSGGGGEDNKKNIQDLNTYAGVIQNFSIKLNQSIYEIISVLEAFFPDDIQIRKIVKDQVNAMKFSSNSQSQNSKKSKNSNQNSNKPQNSKNSNQSQKKNKQEGGNKEFMNRLSSDSTLFITLTTQHLQSMVYMSQAIEYIQLWINRVNSIITNNQLGMSDQCLENAMKMIQSFGSLTSQFRGVGNPVVNARGLGLLSQPNNQ